MKHVGHPNVAGTAVMRQSVRQQGPAAGPQKAECRIVSAVLSGGSDGRHIHRIPHNLKQRSLRDVDSDHGCRVQAEEGCENAGKQRDGTHRHTDTGKPGPELPHGTHTALCSASNGTRNCDPKTKKQRRNRRSGATGVVLLTTDRKRGSAGSADTPCLRWPCRGH